MKGWKWKEDGIYAIIATLVLCIGNVFFPHSDGVETC